MLYAGKNFAFLCQAVSLIADCFSAIAQPIMLLLSKVHTDVDICIRKPGMQILLKNPYG